ncbi:auxin-responsive protein SAUR22-like [Juglans microcarpa x Juglans regia]|uniref:auxin-responsive protein SAUR22-like n=1 Tax=Juglans microcarpa x Juglans regia TaxID=2249226 RepID=UPI001B7E5433|nr:auxin-responsive protein SAUR22-like [Juglans microcarpa x Juglans regia]
MKSGPAGKMKQYRLCRGSNWPKNIHWLMPWSWSPVPNYQKRPAKKLIIRENSCAMKESLLAGDHQLSDGRSTSTTTGVQVIPKGFLAVYVGTTELRRCVIPTSYLSMPDFRILMEKAADEYGYEQEGGLRLPCEEEDFKKILLKC